MARRGTPAPARPPATRARVPGLLALVVVALAYQHSPYVPAPLETGLHVAVPVLASMLLTQLAVRAARSLTARVRVVVDRLQDGELVLRLRRHGPADAAGGGDRG
jgi:uncharacterized membrane protein